MILQAIDSSKIVARYVPWQGRFARLMCLTIPARVLNVEDGDPAFRTAEVDFQGVRRTVSLAFTPEIQPGDFVLTHVGFAISKVEAEAAAEALRCLEEIGALEEGFRSPAETGIAGSISETAQEEPRGEFESRIAASLA